MAMEKIEASFKLKYVYLFSFVLFFDLGSKYYISNNLNDSMTLLPILDLLLVKNTGIALSFLSDLEGIGKIVLSLFIAAALVFIFFEIKKSQNNLQKSSLTLILAGGVGNYIERLFFGAVTDFLHLRVGDFSFFIFNFADLFITLGAILFVYTMFSKQKNMNKEIILANPRGFCAGVDRAIEIVEKSLEKFNEPVFVRHHVVHNKNVVKHLESKGVTFVKEVHEIPDNSIAIFSAHGVSSEVEDSAKLRKFKYFDATCPLVTKVHLEVQKHAKKGRDIVLIGHKGHPEVIGTLGRHPKDSQTNIFLVETLEDIEKLEVNRDNLAYVTQTTLSVDETKEIIAKLKKVYPNIIGPSADDICYATQNRQDAVKQLALESDFVIVIGSKSSSNSNRLMELAENCGTRSCLIDNPEDLDISSLDNVKSIGITAGASAPEYIVQDLIKFLKNLNFSSVRNIAGSEEDITFKLPRELID